MSFLIKYFDTGIMLNLCCRYDMDNSIMQYKMFTKENRVSFTGLTALVLSQVNDGRLNINRHFSDKSFKIKRLLGQFSENS